MRARTRTILERCIDDGLHRGLVRAHKYHEEPSQAFIIQMIAAEVWNEIDENFEFASEHEQYNFTTHE
jgi:hypothetical protein